MKLHFYNTTFFYLLCLFVLSSCSKKSPQEMILGAWQAQWETNAKGVTSNIKPENLRMNGKVIFKDDGWVDISAFGYKGCIFSEDTITNSLRWELGDHELKLIDKGDDQGLAYQVVHFEEHELQLTLLEDIKLTLRRN